MKHALVCFRETNPGVIEVQVVDLDPEDDPTRVATAAFDAGIDGAVLFARVPDAREIVAHMQTGGAIVTMPGAVQLYVPVGDTDA